MITIDSSRRRAQATSAISKRAAGGRLHRLHRGVYAVGHRGLGGEGRWMAAVLACGAGSRAQPCGAPPASGVCCTRSTDPSTSRSRRTPGDARASGIRLHRAARRFARVGDVASRDSGDDGPRDARRPTRCRSLAARRARPQAGGGARAAPRRSRHPTALAATSSAPSCASAGGTGCLSPRSTPRCGHSTVDFLWRSAAARGRNRQLPLPPGAGSPSRTIAPATSALRELGFDVIRVADRQLDEESRAALPTSGRRCASAAPPGSVEWRRWPRTIQSSS